MMQINIHDQTNAQPIQNVHVLNLRNGVPCSLRTIIEQRVRIEHDRALGGYKTHGYANDLIRMPKQATFSLEEAIAAAMSGFEQNAFFMIVDGVQKTDLDEELLLSPASDVTFVKLMPLQGG